MANDDTGRVVRAAASRRMRTPAPYDGSVFVMRIVLEVKAPTQREAKRRTETLLAELVTGAKIDATDLWIRTAALLGGK